MLKTAIITTKNLKGYTGKNRQRQKGNAERKCSNLAAYLLDRRAKRERERKEVKGRKGKVGRRGRG